MGTGSRGVRGARWWRSWRAPRAVARSRGRCPRRGDRRRRCGAGRAATARRSPRPWHAAGAPRRSPGCSGRGRAWPRSRGCGARGRHAGCERGAGRGRGDDVEREAVARERRGAVRGSSFLSGVVVIDDFSDSVIQRFSDSEERTAWKLWAIATPARRATRRAGGHRSARHTERQASGAATRPRGRAHHGLPCVRTPAILDARK